MRKLAFFIATWTVSSLKLSADFQGQPFGVSYCRNVQRHLRKRLRLEREMCLVLILTWDSTTLSSCRLHKVHPHNNSRSSGPLPERPDVRSITNDPSGNLLLPCRGNSIQVRHFSTTFPAQHPLCSHIATLSCYYCLTWLTAKVSDSGPESDLAQLKRETMSTEHLYNRISSKGHVLYVIWKTREMCNVKKCQANTLSLNTKQIIGQLDTWNNLSKIGNITCLANTCGL